MSWAQIEALFHQASELPPEERSTFLAGACEGDQALLDEVLALLEADSSVGESIESAVRGGLVLAHEGDEPPPPERVGPYRIVRELGRGGLSTVYLAERDDQDFRLRVAIKLVRRGMDTADILRRLRRERRILADLDHPNIARLLDGGSTDSGVPYVVMEYVDGEPIDDYCAHHALSVRERVRLMRDVCEAVHVAHQNLIIHRDLKPANVMVTHDGVVKLLDFGIAKVMRPSRAAQTLATATGLRLLTPAFASPEQIRDEPLTTASDVYGLGVLLFRLLTGRHPYRLQDGVAQLEAAICETPPPRPSTVVGTAVATANDAVGPAPLDATRRLRGDLDNIVMMALRKEPQRRYASAQQLAEDLRRFLEQLPILARPDTLRYRAGKFVQRHRVSASAAVLTLLGLVGGLAVATWQAQEARSARAVSEQHLASALKERDRAERITSFMVQLFEVADPSEAKGNRVTAREILDQGAARIVDGLEQTPDVQAALMDTMGRVYQNLGLYDTALPLFENALALRRDLHHGAHPDVAASLNHLGELQQARGELDAAEHSLRRALTQRRAAHGPSHASIAETLNDLAALLTAKGAFGEAEILFEQALDMRRTLLGQYHDSVAETLNNLAVVSYHREDLTAAAERFEAVLDIRRKTLGDRHPTVALNLNNLAAVQRAKGDLSRAEELYREVIDIRRDVLGEEHPDLAGSLNNLGEVLRSRGEYEEAERLYRRSLTIAEAALDESHPTVLRIALNLADTLAETDRLRQARPIFRRVLDARRSQLPDGHLQIAYPLLRLGWIATDLGEPQQGLALLREALAIRSRALPTDHWRVAEAESVLGACLLALDRREEAHGLLTGGLAGLEAARGPEHPLTRAAADRLQRWSERSSG